MPKHEANAKGVESGALFVRLSLPVRELLRKRAREAKVSEKQLLELMLPEWLEKPIAFRGQIQEG